VGMLEGRSVYNELWIMMIWLTALRRLLQTLRICEACPTARSKCPHKWGWKNSTKDRICFPSFFSCKQGDHLTFCVKRIVSIF
jgi:hypothetical protein